MGKQAGKGPQGDLSKVTSKPKGKEKGITIKEPIPQPKQTEPPNDTPQSKHNGKRKVRELDEAPPAIQARTKSIGRVEILLVSATPVPDERLVIHKHPLYGIMIPFNKDTSLPNGSSTTLLNN